MNLFGLLNTDKLFDVLESELDTTVAPITERAGRGYISDYYFSFCVTNDEFERLDSEMFHGLFVTPTMIAMARFVSLAPEIRALPFPIFDCPPGMEERVIRRGNLALVVQWGPYKNAYIANGTRVNIILNVVTEEPVPIDADAVAEKAVQRSN